MKDIIDSIFADLQMEIETGDQKPLLKLPKLEDELRPFVVRELTPEELCFLNARTHAVIENDKMMIKVEILLTMGALEKLDENQKENELIRFKGETLDSLFYWMLNASTGWKYASLFQREDGDKKVLIGLTGPQAREYYTKKKEDAMLAQQPVSSIVN